MAAPAMVEVRFALLASSASWSRKRVVDFARSKTKSTTSPRVSTLLSHREERPLRRKQTKRTTRMRSERSKEG